MGQRSRIDDDAIAGRPLVLDRVDQLAFMIRLNAAQLDAKIPGTFAEQGLEISQRPGSVDLGLTTAERSQVGPIEDQDLHIPRVSASAAETMDGSTWWPGSARPN